MDTQPAVGFKEVVTLMIGDIAKAVSERGGETKQQQAARAQVAVNVIMAFLPRDPIEVMLAGRCLMFHEVMVDSVGATLRGERDAAQRTAHNAIMAMDRRFHANLGRLRDYQERPAEGQRDAPDAVHAAVAAETETVVETLLSTEQPPAGAERTAVPLLNRAARRAAKLQFRAARRGAKSLGPAARVRTMGVPVDGTKAVSDG